MNLAILKLTNKQQGFSLFSVLVAAIFLFFSIILIKITPIYIENFFLTQKLEQLQTDERLQQHFDDETFANEAKKLLRNYFEMNHMSYVQNENINFDFLDNEILIKVKYEARTHLIGNIDLAISFNNSTLYKRP